MCSPGDSLQLNGMQSLLPKCNCHVHLWLFMYSCMHQSSQVWLPEVIYVPVLKAAENRAGANRAAALSEQRMQQSCQVWLPMSLHDNLERCREQQSSQVDRWMQCSLPKTSPPVSQVLGCPSCAGLQVLLSRGCTTHSRGSAANAQLPDR